MLTEKVDRVIKEHRKMKETTLDIQTRSMDNNIIFFSIPEHPSKRSEALVQDFLRTQLKLPPDTVNHITCHKPADYPDQSLSNWTMSKELITN